MQQREPGAGVEPAIGDDPVALGVVAAVAAAAACESAPDRLLDSVTTALATLVPGVFVTFGLAAGDEIVYAGRPVDVVRDRRSSFYERAERAGQVCGPGSDLPPVAALAEVDVAAYAVTAARLGGRVVGHLFAASSVAGFVFSERDLAVLRAIAPITAGAMQHLRAGQPVRDRAAELWAVAVIASAVAGESAPDAVVDAAREPLGTLVDEPFVAYGHRTGSGYRWYGHQAAGLNRSAEEPADEADGASGRPVEAIRLAGAAGVCRFHLSPVTVHATTTGLLLVGSRSPRYEFPPGTPALIETVGQVIGPAVIHALAADQARQEAEEQRAVAAIAAAAAREPDGMRMLDAMSETLAAVLPAPRVSFAYVDGGTARDLGAGGPGAARPLANHEVRALAEGQVCLPAGTAPMSGPAMVTSTHAGGRAGGLLTVSTGDPGFVLTDRHRRLFRLIAEIAGPAMQNARAAAAVAQERALYELILESLDEAVILFDADLVPRYRNRRGEELFGVLGSLWSRLSVDERLSAFPDSERTKLVAALSEGRTVGGRARVPLGEKLWVDYEFLPLEHPEYRLIAVADDVSAEVEVERERGRRQEQMQQAARLAALGELVGGVAHELNNPLTAVLGFAEVLLGMPAASDVHADLDVIHREALRARNIVRDLLFLTRPGPVEQRPVDLVAIVEHVRRLRRTAWEQAGIRAALHLGEGSGPVHGNEHHLAQVLLNLVTNAEHALAGRDDPVLEIEVRAQADGATVLEVRDNGCGIESATAGRVFEPFFTTKQGHGTGLGLSLCRSIVQAHGGAIDVESSPGRGSTFRVTLPPPAAGAEPEEIEPEPRAPARMRVLVVDDEPSIRAIAQRVIRALGHECLVAADVASGFSLVLAEPFDLVICDYRLGNETALALIDRMLERVPAAVERTVITTGATTDPGVVTLAHRHGLRVLPKPFGKSDLQSLLGESAA